MKEVQIRFFILCSLFLLGSCEYPDLTVSKPSENLRPAGEFIRNNYEFKLFYEALVYTGLYEELNGKGPFTVLAPNNLSFNDIGISTRSDLEKLNRDSLRQAMAYHILPMNLPTKDIPTNAVDARYLTLSGEQLYARAQHQPSGGLLVGLYFDGASVLHMGINLANGSLYGLNKVMKYHQNKTVQDFLASRKEYSLFVAGLKKFGLWNELSEAGPFTVFAPTNEALEEVGLGQQALDNMNPNAYIAARLYGTYIMYGRHFFISDFPLSPRNSTGNIYNYKLRNDEGTSLRWTATQENVFTDPQQQWYYNLYIENGLRSDNNRFPGQSDNRFNNGIVHRLKNALMRPENARSNN